MNPEFFQDEIAFTIWMYNRGNRLHVENDFCFVMALAQAGCERARRTGTNQSTFMKARDALWEMFMVLQDERIV
jgi:hypothetical protein